MGGYTFIGIIYFIISYGATHVASGMLGEKNKASGNFWFTAC